MTANEPKVLKDPAKPVRIYVKNSGVWELSAWRTLDGSIRLVQRHKYSEEEYVSTLTHDELELCVWTGSGWSGWHMPRFNWSELRMIGEQCKPSIQPILGQSLVMSSERYVSMWKENGVYYLELIDKGKPVIMNRTSLPDIWKAGQEFLFPFNEREHLRK